jgi:hypothetical protein
MIFKACAADKKIIITTEKGYAAFRRNRNCCPLPINLPIYTLPIGVEFLNNGGQQFNDTSRKLC